MEKALKVEAVAWCDEAARYLASSFGGSPCFTLEDYRRELANNPDAKLYRVTEEAGGNLVGYVVARLEVYASGDAEGVIVAAAGRLVGARLYSQVLPGLEKLFSGVKCFRVEAFRAGAVRELARCGYVATHVVMRKVATPAGRVDVTDGLLEAVTHAGGEAYGDGRRGSAGGDIRSRPGKLHGGGGGRTSSSSSADTSNIDRRVVADNGAIALSGDVSTIQVLDGGAIAGALDLVKASDQNTAKTVNDLLGFTKDIFTVGAKQIQQQSDLVAKAYDQARGEGTQKNLVVVATLAAVAFVAVKVMK